MGVNMLKALVTGGAGFIGSHLARTLVERDYAVDILDRHGEGTRDGVLADLLARPNVRMLEADLRRRDTAAALDTDYDRIFHMASVMEVAQAGARPYDVLTANVAILETTLAIARRQRALGRILYASNCEVGTLTSQAFGRPAPDGGPSAIGDLTAPDTCHLLSKLYGEAMCRSSGVPYTIVRFATVYGPRMERSHLLAQLLEKAHRLAPDEPLSMDAVHPERPFCYVDDAVEYLVRMSMLPGCSNQTYSVTPPSPDMRTDDLSQVVLHAVGRSTPPARPNGEGPAPRAFDLRKAIDATGFQPRIDLATGLKRTYGWYRDHVFGNASAGAD